MCESKAAYLIQIDNYTTIHKARSSDKNGGGGVALLIRNDVKFCQNAIFNDINLEICAINVEVNNLEVIVLSYYNPPHCSLSKEVFDILKETKKNYIVLGDLNAKSTCWEAITNNVNGEILNDIILENDCLVVNNKEFTHFGFNQNTRSILDYGIISSKLYDFFDSFTVLSDEDMTSDHVPILLEFNSSYLRKSEMFNNQSNKIYNFHKANWNEFKIYLMK